MKLNLPQKLQYKRDWERKKEFSMEENYYSVPQKLLQESVLETTTGEWLGNYLLVVGASETTISSAWKPSTRGCLEKYY